MHGLADCRSPQDPTAAAYAARPDWPGTRERHADTALAAAGLVLVLALAARDVPALLVVYLATGALEGPAVVARSLHLEAILPEHRRGVGFSLQYAAPARRRAG